MRFSASCLLIPLLCTTPALAHGDEGTARPAAAAGEVVQLIPEAELPLDPRFSPDRFRAHVAFLADDLLEGRDTGSVGYEIAARYVAQRFAAIGLKPAGEDGSWFQRITFQKTEATDGPAGMTIFGANGAETFDQGGEVLISLNPNMPDLDFRAPLVFVGYGLENARMGIDDYAGLDVTGKIVVALRGFPPALPSEAAAHLVSSKAEVAQAHGAIGMIQIDTNLSLAMRSWEKRVRYSTGRASFAWVGKDGKAFDETPGIRAGASVSDAVARMILSGAPQSLEQLRAQADQADGRPKGFPLSASARLYRPSKSSRVTSPNIVAMLPGSDPVLAEDIVILSGHLDHIGINPARPDDTPETDRINNGAMDNAAGVAAMLEVAHVMAGEAVKPRRSLVFVVSTAEEKGLLGADYFARHTTVPRARIVGNVDLDMPVISYAFNDVVAYGGDHSTIGALAAKALAPMKIKLAPDPMPEQTVFVRSDHYMFVKQGIPAIFPATGYGNGGEAAWTDFEGNRYHQPGDDMNQAVDWRAGARFAEVNYRITRAMADADTPPLWYEGDFFGDIFAPSAARAKP